MKGKLIKPEENVEYVFRFRRRTGQITQWNLIYDRQLGNGRLAFFNLQSGGITDMAPERFSHIYRNNLIEQKRTTSPTVSEKFKKELERRDVAKREEEKRRAEEEAQWEEVLKTFKGLNVFQQKQVEACLSMPYRTFFSRLERWVKNENLTLSFVDSFSKELVKASETLNLKLKALNLRA